MRDAPFRDPGFDPQRYLVERRDDGSLIVRNATPLGTVDADLLVAVERGAALWPERAMLAERDAGDWRTLTYRAALTQIRQRAAGMMKVGLGPGRPLAILSGNSIDHAVTAYAAAMIGAPVCPISVAYSLADPSLHRLRAIFDLIKPWAVFATPADAFDAALGFAARAGCVQLQADTAAYPEHDLDARREAVTGDAIVRYALTSGSTGAAKAVATTHRMITTSAAMIRSAFTDAALSVPPVVVSGLPWSHTFGVNAHLHQAITDGGTLVIDSGAPTRLRFAATVETLRAFQPVVSYTTVPVAWDMLADQFEADAAFAGHFFERLKWIAYGGAAMQQATCDRIQAAAIRATGTRIAMTTGYGATETAPAMAMVTNATDRVGQIGLPLPGATLKLIPIGDRFEVRCSGDAVMAGYAHDHDRSAQAFDDEQFYLMGDAVRLIDPVDPLLGLTFDGRLVEDFKLASGTFVAVGRLRSALMEMIGDLAFDVVPCGENRNAVGLLVFPGQGHIDICTLRERISHHNHRAPASSTRIGHMILAEPPSLERGEITDKGVVNQQRIRALRGSEIERLFSDPNAAIAD